MGWVRLVASAAVGGVAMLLTACQGESFPMVPLEGTLLKAGKPMSNVKVEFLPERESGVIGPRSCAVTDDRGRFRLQTDAGEDGAVVGKHRVLLVDVEYLIRTAPFPKDHPLALKYKGLPPPVKRVGGEYEDYFRTPLRSEATPPGSSVTIEIR